MATGFFFTTGVFLFVWCKTLFRIGWNVVVATDGYYFIILGWWTIYDFVFYLTGDLTGVLNFRVEFNELDPSTEKFLKSRGLKSGFFNSFVEITDFRFLVKWLWVLYFDKFVLILFFCFFRSVLCELLLLTFNKMELCVSLSGLFKFNIWVLFNYSVFIYSV